MRQRRPDEPVNSAPPVRYYPRRMARAGRRAPLSPAQALHLADDPVRAEHARSTAEHRWHVPRFPPAPGRLRRMWWRLTGRTL